MKKEHKYTLANPYYTTSQCFTQYEFNMKNPPLQLQFYTKSDCPLCDEAKKELNKIEAKLPFISVEEIDITKNIGLFSKYKLLIPALELDGKQIFIHRFNSSKVIWLLRWYRICSNLTKK